MSASPFSKINNSPLEYWRRTKYSAVEVNKVCEELDTDSMAIRLVFDGNQNIDATVSTKTWQRQQGHYPTIIKYFREIAQHPSLKGKRGSLIVLLEDGLWPWFTKFAARSPLLTFGRHIHDYQSFVIPDPSYLKTRGYEDDQAKTRILLPQTPWPERRPTVFWRGAATGLGIESYDWKRCARGTLTTFAKELNDPSALDAKFTRVSNLPSEQQELIRNKGLVDEVVPFEEFFKYRYVVDADGYSCAWASLFLKLLSGSVVLKMQSNYEQWYYQQLIPWKHYIPLAHDLSNFRECLEWLRTHDEQACRMAAEARELVSGISYEKLQDEMAELCAALLDCYDESPAEK